MEALRYSISEPLVHVTAARVPVISTLESLLNKSLFVKTSDIPF